MTGRDGIARVGIAVQAGKPMTAQGNGGRGSYGGRASVKDGKDREHEKHPSTRHSYRADPVRGRDSGRLGLCHCGGVGFVQW